MNDFGEFHDEHVTRKPNVSADLQAILEGAD